MTDATPDDFDADDSSLDDRLVECCAKCDKMLGVETGHLGEIWTQSGRRYDYFLDSDPGEAPFFCPDCWPELERNRKASENNQLGDFE